MFKDWSLAARAQLVGFFQWSKRTPNKHVFRSSSVLKYCTYWDLRGPAASLESYSVCVCACDCEPWGSGQNFVQRVFYKSFIDRGSHTSLIAWNNLQCRGSPAGLTTSFKKGGISQQTTTLFAICIKLELIWKQSWCVKAKFSEV